MASSSAGGRFMKLAGMTASIAGKAVSTSIRSINASEEDKLAAKSKLYTEIGLQIAKTLGEMKGAVMKVGQMLSQFQDILPPEIATAISTLQRQAPSVPFPTIEAQIIRELGKPSAQIFQSFEQIPFAAASIGQVHRAVLHNGQRVVVKVQYPGVDESCDSDLKQIRMALRLAGVLKIDRKLQDELFEEFESSLHAELDYRMEAHNLQVFSAFHAKLDPKIIIPKPLLEYSSRRILTLTEEMGESIETAATFLLAVRNELGQRIFGMMSEQIFKLNCFHCDPHPGNFAFRADGSLVVYDFGGIKELTPTIVNAYKKTVRASLVQDIPALEDALRVLEVRNHTGQVPATFYNDWSEMLLKPINQQFDFSVSTVHHDTISMLKKSFKYIDSFQPSPHTIMINRAVSGHYWNMIALKVFDNFSPLTQHYING